MPPDPANDDDMIPAPLRAAFDASVRESFAAAYEMAAQIAREHADRMVAGAMPAVPAYVALRMLAACFEAVRREMGERDEVRL